jgi:hypothetical protein
MQNRDILEWIERESRNLGFGELTITLKYHDGRLAVIERSKSEKSKLECNMPSGRSLKQREGTHREL